MSLSAANATSSSPIGPMPQNPKARLQKAAHEMEGLWIGQMLKDATPKGGMFNKSFAAQTFQDMMNQALAQKIADTGLIGLADSLTRQLMPGTPAPQNAPAEKGDHHG